MIAEAEDIARKGYTSILSLPEENREFAVRPRFVRFFPHARFPPLHNIEELVLISFARALFNIKEKVLRFGAITRGEICEQPLHLGYLFPR